MFNGERIELSAVVGMKYIDKEETDREEIEDREEMFMERLMSVDIPDTKKKGKIQVDHQEIIIKPGGEDIEHYHEETYDLFTVKKGEAHLEINDDKIVLNEGDSILVEPEDEHKIYNPTGSEAIIIETRLNVIEDDFYET